MYNPFLNPSPLDVDEPMLLLLVVVVRNLRMTRVKLQ
jgi:hypothetical protein